MAIDLQKKVSIAKGVMLRKNIPPYQKAQIKIAVDRSGSMSYDFSHGNVQELITRGLGVGMNMDVDKSIDVFAFNTGGDEIGKATESNIDGFVDNVFLKKVRASGGTKYSPVMKMIVDSSVNKASGFKSLFGKKPNVTTDTPTLVFFITDGELERSDRDATERIIRETANQPIFWQFIGIGSEQFEFLQKLDDLTGRFLDNADFFKVQDPIGMSDEQFYMNILNEFPSWVQQAKSKGILL